MEDDIIDPKTGKPRRHDGRDPWSLMARDEVLARTDLGDFVPPAGADAPSAIAVGGYAQVVLVRERADPQGRYEALWVELTGTDETGFTAVFDNQPTWVRGLAAGDPLRLEARHILRFRRA